MTDPVLQVRDLRVSYGRMQALRGASLAARAGEVIGIVGESGCGKSTLASALIGLAAPGAAVSGEVRIAGEDMVSLAEDRRRALRGAKVAMIFQDPMTAFNPVLSLGDQLTDFQHHLPLPHVHELSGGMRQRAAIAAALLMQPEVLVADEPTTALDVTMEAQILHLLRELRRDHSGAIVIVTHHLGVVGELCDRVYVMYAGEVVEEGTVEEIYHSPRHPYTAALIACDPTHLEGPVDRLPTIAGQLPDLTAPPAGCSFAARCNRATARCQTTQPPRVRLSPTQAAFCHEVRP
jgi:oligopeptide/dipeptide ABC transporter ATP-binding protein